MPHPARKLLWLLLFCIASGTGYAGTPVDFSVTLLDGRSFSARDYRGDKPVLLKFWATWCVACRNEMPAFREMHARLAKRVAFLAVNVAISDPLENVRAAIRQRELEMPVAYDAAGALWKQFDVIGTPTYVLIDRQGNVAWIGHRHDGKLERAVQDVLRGAPSSPASSETEKNDAPLVDIPLVDIDGGAVQLAAGEGETVIAYRFATWCESYLRDSNPALSEQCRRFREGIARLAALNLPRTRLVGFAAEYSSNIESVHAWRARNGIAHPLVFDDAGVFATRFGMRDFPRLVVIRNGSVIHATDRIDETLVDVLRHGK